SKRKQAKRFAAVKRMISLNDGRIHKRDRDKPAGKKRKPAETNSDPLPVRHKTAVSSAMFLHYNTQIGPPYHILLDTNYVNFAIKNRLDVFQSAMDCLYGKCVLYVTDCVLAEMEKMGEKYRVALKILHDPRVRRLSCLHKGTYADDCLVRRVTDHKFYIVATCDRDLRRRLRRVPGVPIMYVHARRVTVERMPDALGAPR
ncbi:hypothetical protein BOX15_Mlig032850g1, partial [Macrostomum lignano]